MNKNFEYSNLDNQYNYQLKKIHDSIDKKHQIEITIIDNIAWFNIINIEYEFYKTFLDLLKDIIKIFNKNNVEYIKQYISSGDIQYFKYSEYIQIDNDCYIITTKIVDFPNEIFEVLGINKI